MEAEKSKRGLKNREADKKRMKKKKLKKIEKNFTKRLACAV